MQPMPAPNNVRRHPVGGCSNAHGALPIRRRISIRLLRDYQVYVCRAGRIFDNGPEIAFEIIQNQRSNFIQIQSETKLTALSLQRSCKPLGYCPRLARCREGMDEIRLRPENRRQRLEHLDDTQSAVTTERRAWPGNAVDHDDLLEGERPSTNRRGFQ